ncbi:MAG: metallophosphoesterase [Chloroflexota bacterium]
MEGDGAGSDTFIVGDIHGDLVGLSRALWGRALLRSGRWRKGAHLICVGDYTDRNAGGLGVLRLLRQLEEDGHATCLLGNHDITLIATALVIRRHGFLPDAFTDMEQMARLQMKSEEDVLAWLFHSCGARAEDALAVAADDDLLAWLRRRPLMDLRGDFLIVHADNTHPLEWGATIADVNALGRRVTEGDSLEQLLTLFSGLTDRYAFVTQADTLPLPADGRDPEERAAAPDRLAAMLNRFGGRMLIHGHSVFTTGDADPLVYAGGQVINVDRGAGYSARGGMLCLCSLEQILARICAYHHALEEEQPAEEQAAGGDGWSSVVS